MKTNRRWITAALATGLLLASLSGRAEAGADPNIVLAWTETGSTASTRTYTLSFTTIENAPDAPRTLSLDLTWPDAALDVQGTITTTLSATDFGFFADPITGLPAGTEGRKISVFSNTDTPIALNAVIATVTFNIPATDTTVTMAPDASGGVFGSIELLDAFTTFPTLNVLAGAATPTPTEAPTATPTEAPTATPTDAPTASPTEAPTASATEAPTATPTDAPTATPTEAPTATATEAPTATPTEAPTATATDAPTATPTDAATATPTDAATATPTDAATATPTEAPTASATEAPTATPTDAATATPTDAATATPTEAPTASATEAPTATATEAPTATPTDAPTATPTEAPTASPTTTPTSLTLGWTPTVLRGSTANFTLFVASVAGDQFRPDTMSLDVTWNSPAVSLASAVTSAIPSDIAVDYQFNADPLGGLPAGTEGRRLSVFRVDTQTENFRQGDGIANFSFNEPASAETITLAPEAAGGVFNGVDQLDSVTDFQSLVIGGAPTATPTDAPTATPTDAATATPTDAPTATPTDAPTATPTEAPTPTANPFSLTLGWTPTALRGGTANFTLFVKDVASDTFRPDTMSLDLTWNSPAVSQAAEAVSAIPSDIAVDYQFNTDPLNGLPAGREGRRISVFRVDTQTQNFREGDGIASFSFNEPASAETIDLAPDPSGGVFNGVDQLDSVTLFESLTIGGVVPTPTPTDAPTPTPTDGPTATPTDAPTPTPDGPTATPTEIPTETATPTPSASPTADPGTFDVALGWQPVSLRGTNVTLRLFVSEFTGNTSNPDTFNLITSWLPDVDTVGDPVSAIPASIAGDYDFAADAVTGADPNVGTGFLGEGYRITIFRVDKALGPFAQGDGIADFTFVEPAAEREVRLDPDVTGGVFAGVDQLDSVTDFQDTFIGGVVPTPTPTDAPTATPTATVTPTDAPTATATDAPTVTPTDAPTATATDAPTATPTDAPTATATDAPTATPTDAPTATATDAPTASPTDAPTATATDAPTATPTDAATATPTAEATASPTDAATATPTDAPTATPTVTPSATPTPTPIVFEFPTDTQGWVFVPQLNAVPDNGFFSPEFLNTRAATDSGYFAFWESPAFMLPGSSMASLADSETITIEGGDSYGFYATTFTLVSDQTDATQVPTIRLRNTTMDAAQSDVLAIESVADASTSPTAGAPQSYTMIWRTAATAPLFKLQYDLLNFNQFGAAGAVVSLDRVTVQAVDAATLASPTLEGSFSFNESEEGWTYRAGDSSVFEAPTGTYTDGGLAITSVPFTTYTQQFGWWNAPETGASNVVLQAGRLYWAEFTVTSTSTDANTVPSGRLRLNTGDFKVARLTQFASNFMEPFQTSAQNVPSAGNPKTYYVVFPPALATGQTLVPSFDLLSTSGDSDSTSATISLDSLNIYSVPISE